MNKPKIFFDSKSESGNIFHVLGLCRNELNLLSYKILRKNVLNSKSYTDALKEIRKHVNLIDVRGEY
jgi:hypothetical protein